MYHTYLRKNTYMHDVLFEKDYSPHRKIAMNEIILLIDGIRDYLSLYDTRKFTLTQEEHLDVFECLQEILNKSSEDLCKNKNFDKSLVVFAKQYIDNIVDELSHKKTYKIDNSSLEMLTNLSIYLKCGGWS